jgi:hypothetical protein
MSGPLALQLHQAEIAHASAFPASSGHANLALHRELDAHALTSNNVLSLSLCLNLHETTHGPALKLLASHQHNGFQKHLVSPSGSHQEFLNNHQTTGSHNHQATGNHNHQTNGSHNHHKITHGNDHLELKKKSKPKKKIPLLTPKHHSRLCHKFEK